MKSASLILLLCLIPEAAEQFSLFRLWFCDSVRVLSLGVSPGSKSQAHQILEN